MKLHQIMQEPYTIAHVVRVFAEAEVPKATEINLMSVFGRRKAGFVQASETSTSH
jgi:hypothetical protein